MPSEEDMIIPEDTQKLCDLLQIVSLLADVSETDDEEDYIITFHDLGQHDGELLLNRIRKLASKVLVDTNGIANLENINILRNYQYRVGPIEYDKNKWTTTAIYTQKGAIYF